MKVEPKIEPLGISEQLPKQHKCASWDICLCDIQATEPKHYCPIHGCPGQPRCRICGRFMTYEQENVSLWDDSKS